MFNKVFLTDLLERAVSTALQAWAAAFAIPGPDILDSIKMLMVLHSAQSLRSDPA